MKKTNNKKITRSDFDAMWGGDGPYSQVNILEQSRILDDSISRVFLVVEAEINPFTFEYVKKNAKKFENDEAVLQLLKYAEYRGKFGYVVGAGEVEIIIKGARKFAEKQRDATIETIIRMHTFVINECNLQTNTNFGVMNDKNAKEHFIWNDKEGKVEVVNDSFFDNETLVSSQSGMKNNAMRFFFVIAFVHNFELKSKTTLSFIKIIKSEADTQNIEIENCEAFMDHLVLSVLIPLDIPPAQYIESVIHLSNKIQKKSIFKEKYLVTNVSYPTPDEVVDFLSKL